MATDIVLQQEDIEVLTRILKIARAEGKEENIRLDARWAALYLGGGEGQSQEGDVRLLNAEGEPVIHLTAGGGGTSNQTRVYVRGDEGLIEAETVKLPTGRGGIKFSPLNEQACRIWSDGDQLFMEAPFEVRVRGRLSAHDLDVGDLHGTRSTMKSLRLGVDIPDAESPYAGKLEVNNAQGRTTVRVEGSDDGDIFVHDKEGNETIHLGGTDARLRLGKSGGNDGDIFVHDKDGNETIHLGGNDARIRLGKEGGNDGDIFIHDQNGNETIHLRGDGEVKVEVRGKIKATEVDTASDARCKEAIETITDAADKVSRLRGVGFRWQEGACADRVLPSRNLGLIAQEVQEVLPEAVTQDDDGYYSVAYNQLIPVLIEAVKDQQQTIDALRAENRATQQTLQEAVGRADRLESVEGRLAKLERMLEAQPA